MDNNDLYKIVDEFRRSSAESGFKEPEIVDPNIEIPKINKKLKFFNNVLIGIISILGIAFIGFIIDAIYFHVTNNEYSEKQVDINNSFNEIKNQNNSIELKIQEMETGSGALNNIIENDTIRKSEKIELENKINQQQNTLDCLKNKRY